MLDQNVSMPSSWCKDAQDLFSPVKSLGVGGFGHVWLARQKKNSYTDHHSKHDDYDGEEKKNHEEATKSNHDGDLVAIKLVGHPHNQKISSFLQMSEAGYFKREVSILQEISHPRIVQCLQVIEDTTPNSSCAPYLIVLEFCRGPTVEKMLQYGGALGIHLAQEVSSQLIDAISYLHGRGVIHRDIKPDNIIVRGAKLNDEACWSDDIVDGSDAANSIHRWNIKLVDFGFARPLRPEDITDETNVLKKKKEPSDEFFGARSTVNGQLDDTIHESGAFGLDSGNKALDLSNSTNNSISRQKVRDLSAVGNRNFSAPEVKKGIRLFKKGKNSKDKKQQNGGRSEPLTEYVSDYGMIVDAFSTGASIRYMCTGVPPQFNVEEFIDEKNSAFHKLGGKVKNIFKKNTAKTRKRKKRFRSNQELPKEAVRLILGLTHWNVAKRTTIRSARDYDWISSSYSMKNSLTKHHEFENHGNRNLDYLQCAM